MRQGLKLLAGLLVVLAGIATGLCSASYKGKPKDIYRA
jgi:hypothetical protein